MHQKGPFALVKRVLLPIDSGNCRYTLPPSQGLMLWRGAHQVTSPGAPQSARPKQCAPQDTLYIEVWAVQ